MFALAHVVLALRRVTARPHDALFKATFGVPAYAVELFRAVLPPELFSAIDWTQLRVENASFIDRELADHHSDLLFSVAHHDGSGRVLLYVLVEHQSRPDGDMPLRLLGYLVQIWDRERKLSPNAPLPLILPMVISHAPEGWLAPSALSELFDAEAAFVGSLFADYLPRLRILVEDLGRITNAEIRARLSSEIPRLVWWVLRDARSRTRLLDNISAWGDVLDAAVSRDPRSLEQIVAYLAQVTDPFPVEEFRDKLRTYAPATGETVMTWTEQLLRQGRDEGRAEGRAEGRRDVVIRLLEAKFGALSPKARSRIAAATPDELDGYAVRLLSADSVEAVLGLE